LRFRNQFAKSVWEKKMFVISRSQSYWLFQRKFRYRHWGCVCGKFWDHWWAIGLEIWGQSEKLKPDFAQIKFSKILPYILIWPQGPVFRKYWVFFGEIRFPNIISVAGSISAYNFYRLNNVPWVPKAESDDLWISRFPKNFELFTKETLPFWLSKPHRRLSSIYVVHGWFSYRNLSLGPKKSKITRIGIWQRPHLVHKP
jgi:hypothetical protein